MSDTETALSRMEAALARFAERTDESGVWVLPVYKDEPDASLIATLGDLRTVVTQLRLYRNDDTERLTPDAPHDFIDPKTEALFDDPASIQHRARQ